MKAALVISVYLLLASPIYSQSAKYFIRHYGDSGGERGNAILQIGNSSYVIVGTKFFTCAFVAEFYNLYLRAPFN